MKKNSYHDRETRKSGAKKCTGTGCEEDGKKLDPAGVAIGECSLDANVIVAAQEKEADTTHVDLLK